jgi:hypothetical protein
MHITLKHFTKSVSVLGIHTTDILQKSQQLASVKVVTNEHNLRTIDYRTSATQSSTMSTPANPEPCSGICCRCLRCRRWMSLRRGRVWWEGGGMSRMSWILWRGWRWRRRTKRGWRRGGKGWRNWRRGGSRDERLLLLHGG